MSVASARRFLKVGFPSAPLSEQGTSSNAGQYLSGKDGLRSSWSYVSCFSTTVRPGTYERTDKGAALRGRVVVDAFSS